DRRRPVAGPRGIENAHITGGIDIAQPRDDAGGPAEHGPVGDDLVAGEDGEVGQVLRRQQQTAEGDVVPGGVLDTGEHTLLPEADEDVEGHLHVCAHGHVVGEEGNVDVVGDSAQVALDLGGVRQRIE